jgi:hypothetical protein
LRYSQFSAETVAAALIELMTASGKKHILPKDGNDSRHKTLHFADPLPGAPRLLMDVSGGTGYGRYRQYFDGVNFWMTVNAYIDAANSFKWTHDRGDLPALAIHMKYTTGQMYLAHKSSGAAWEDWNIMFDIQAAAIALNRDVDIDGDLRCDNVNTGTVAATAVNASSRAAPAWNSAKAGRKY